MGTWTCGHLQLTTVNAEMDYGQAFAISASGMNFEKLRLDAVASNLANTNVASGPDGVAYRPLRAVGVPAASFGSAFNSLSRSSGLGVIGVRMEAVDSAPRLAHDPGHPYADKSGNVAYPAVDQVTEMATMSSALRSYQANVLAMTATKAMALKALDIGSSK